MAAPAAQPPAVAPAAPHTRDARPNLPLVGPPQDPRPVVHHAQQAPTLLPFPTAGPQTVAARIDPDGSPGASRTSDLAQRASAQLSGRHQLKAEAAAGPAGLQRPQVPTTADASVPPALLQLLEDAAHNASHHPGTPGRAYVAPGVPVAATAPSDTLAPVLQTKMSGVLHPGGVCAEDGVGMVTTTSGSSEPRVAKRTCRGARAAGVHEAVTRGELSPGALAAASS